jgi:hypothetical protein
MQYPNYIFIVLLLLDARARPNGQSQTGLISISFDCMRSWSFLDKSNQEYLCKPWTDFLFDFIGCRTADRRSWDEGKDAAADASIKASLERNKGLV